MSDPRRSLRGTLGALALIVLSSLLVPAAAPAQAPVTDGQPLAGGFILAGDQITVQVWRQPEFSGDFFVTEQGVIGHPIFRNIGRVAGRNVEDIQPLIEEFLREYEQEPNVVVQVFFRVAVGGEVRQPNVHFLRPGTTVAQAVALAGGVTERGRTDEIVLRRRGRDYTMNLSDPSLPDQRSVIFSGDEITVNRRGNFWRGFFLPAVSFLGSAAAIYNAVSR